MGLHCKLCGRRLCLEVKGGGSEQSKWSSIRGILAGDLPEVLRRAGAMVAGLSVLLLNTTSLKRWLSLVAASQTTSKSPSTSLRNTHTERERLVSLQYTVDRFSWFKYSCTIKCSKKWTMFCFTLKQTHKSIQNTHEHTHLCDLLVILYPPVSGFAHRILRAQLCNNNRY